MNNGLIPINTLLFGDKYKTSQMLADESPIKDELTSLCAKRCYYFFRDYAINAMMKSGKIVNVDKEIIYTWLNTMPIFW